MRGQDLRVLKQRLAEIKQMGWIENRRPGNVGGVGNTLEDLLGVAENNRQLPDFGEWELKSQRRNTGALLTLFHVEPEPRAAVIVPKILLPRYGWAHQEAGGRYAETERRFSLTINALSHSDRGFRFNIDRESETLFLSFEFDAVSDKHDEWREFIRKGVGTADISPRPFWTFETIVHKLNDKIKTCCISELRAKRKTGLNTLSMTALKRTSSRI